MPAPARQNHIVAETIVDEPLAAEPAAPFEVEIPEVEPVAEVETPPVVAQQRAILERFDAEDAAGCAELIQRLAPRLVGMASASAGG